MSRHRHNLEEIVEILERFVRAHDAVEAGVLDFDLQREAAEELREARAAIDWIPWERGDE